MPRTVSESSESQPSVTASGPIRRTGVRSQSTLNSPTNATNGTAISDRRQMRP